jgi:hypothetical protein
MIVWGRFHKKCCALVKTKNIVIERAYVLTYTKAIMWKMLVLVCLLGLSVLYGMVKRL